LRVSEIDVANCWSTLDGKGRKQRIVPFSFELRKSIFRYITDYNATRFAVDGESERNAGWAGA